MLGPTETELWASVLCEPGSRDCLPGGEVELGLQLMQGQKCRQAVSKGLAGLSRAQGSHLHGSPRMLSPGSALSWASCASCHSMNGLLMGPGSPLCWACSPQLGSALFYWRMGWGLPAAPFHF